MAIFGKETHYFGGFTIPLSIVLFVAQMYLNVFPPTQLGAVFVPAIVGLASGAQVGIIRPCGWQSRV